ncbi:unnamed protein product [Rotaria socialis]|uniref:N-acetyltransferase domain-containing protein n=1 Tax=Rotaria socialis TaxID=392032 RepID=A0A821HJE0_9BILA|nr:unnamed protein product [Rotaria socialis]CAF3766568.1 unnamed protein product [Rotaria socialis]CAF4289422.1 unnamed protein product [Rotaria socialis]CAF4683575.1 unnamed protein product [Rotaria socialis]
MTSSHYKVDAELYVTNQLTHEDIPSLIKYLNNQIIHVNTLNIPYPYTTKDGENFIEKVKSASVDSTYFFTIRLNANNELIGACGLYRSVKNKTIATIGYWLGEPYWHRGLMPKVVKKIIEIIRIEWKNLVRIEAHIFSWNKASMRVVEKCDFEFEGILRKLVHKDGEDIDVHSYALII